MWPTVNKKRNHYSIIGQRLLHPLVTLIHKNIRQLKAKVLGNINLYQKLIPPRPYAILAMWHPNPLPHILIVQSLKEASRGATYLRNLSNGSRNVGMQDIFRIAQRL